jgi:hypothetical protein
MCFAVLEFHKFKEIMVAAESCVKVLIVAFSSGHTFVFRNVHKQRLQPSSIWHVYNVTSRTENPSAIQL